MVHHIIMYILIFEELSQTLPFISHQHQHVASFVICTPKRDSKCKVSHLNYYTHLGIWHVPLCMLPNLVRYCSPFSSIFVFRPFCLCILESFIKVGSL